MKVSVFLLLGALALFAVGVSASNPDGAQTTFREITDEEEDLALSELTDVTERGGEPGCVDSVRRATTTSVAGFTFAKARMVIKSVTTSWYASAFRFRMSVPTTTTGSF
eukprot:CAMPEP_0198325396 /NCGR_PEP_ID=MMETSP1450-20131203/13154_1 /TAXON_ID=753684 ORGANISM="Madagascaria erythrocladiodes, Strain CCMP3234" /NCGR_SAMPLE_ID=MMETSP1450 /ASSEMBLY_ACC=CAM_ASM_001115 /LENGTH=108 /DNA_ID=CAMNT_0044029277 /DNA_START=235 /DNA_END=562 /DNA_ORIENTATION=+